MSNFETFENTDLNSGSQSGTCVLEDEKRKAIASLDTERERISTRKNVRKNRINPEVFTVGHALSVISKAVRGMQHLESCVDALRRELDKGKNAGEELRISKDTCKMLEDSLLSLENKLLDAIAENGGLFHQIDKLENELLNARISLARLSRQRDELRCKLEDASGINCEQRRALSDAEREIAVLSEKLSGSQF